MTAPRPLQHAPEETARKERTHSGRLLLRMPETLHGELARAADRAGISLNQFITTTLADSVGDKPPTLARATGRSRERGRVLPVLLAINLVVVATAGVLAIILLVNSWHG